MEHLSKILLSRNTHHQHHRESSENSTSSRTTNDSTSFKMSSDNQSPVDTPPSQSQEMDVPPFPSVASNEVAAIPKKRGRPAKNKTFNTASAQTTPTTLGDTKITKSNKSTKKNPPGRRKKAVGDAKTQARYNRMFELKRSYRELANLMKPGLQTLLERSLDTLTEKPDQHKLLPEYHKIEFQLQSKAKARAEQLEKETEVRSAYLRKRYEMQVEYANKLHECRMKDIQEKSELRAKKKIMNLHPSNVSNKVPYADDKHDQPQVIVVEDDDEPERPAHAAKGPGLAITASSKNKSPSKKVSPLKRRANNDDHLDAPSPKRPALSRAEPSNDKLNVPASFHRASIFGNVHKEDEGTPLPPSRGPSPEAGGAGKADSYGVFIPNKVRRGRGNTPNNRVVVDAWLEFGDHEIGIWKRGANPPKLYLEQAVNVTHTKMSERTADDLPDQELCRIYKLHPQYGIPVKGSGHPTNPDDIPTPTDFSKPPARTNPLRFVSKDGKRYDTSRSAKWIYIEQDWEKFEADKDVRSKMGNFLHAIDAEEPFLRELSNVQREEQKQVDQEDANAAVATILDAASQVETDELINKKNEARIEAAQVAALSTIPQSPPRLGPGSLEALADAAEAVSNITAQAQTSQLPPLPQPLQQPQPRQPHHQVQQVQQVQQADYGPPRPRSQPPHQQQLQQMEYAEVSQHSQHSQQLQQMHQAQEMQHMHHQQHSQQPHQAQQPQQPMPYTYPSPSAPIAAPMVGYSSRPQTFLPPILPPPQMMGPTHPPFQSNPHFSPPMNQSRHRELRPAPPQGDHPPRHFAPPVNTLPPYMGPVVQPGYPGAPPPPPPQQRHPFTGLPQPPNNSGPVHYYGPPGPKSGPWWYEGPNA